MTQELRVRSGHGDVARVLADLASLAEEETLSLRSERNVPTGEWVRFTVELRDNTPVIEGIGRCLTATRNGNAFYVLLDQLQFDERNEVMYERILLERESRASGEPTTGVVHLDELEEIEPTSPASRPDPERSSRPTPPPPPAARASSPPARASSPPAPSRSRKATVPDAQPPVATPPSPSSFPESRARARTAGGSRASSPPKPRASATARSRPSSRASAPPKPRAAASAPREDETTRVAQARAMSSEPLAEELTRRSSPPPEPPLRPIEPELTRRAAAVIDEPEPPSVLRSPAPPSAQTVREPMPDHTLTREIVIDRAALEVPAELAIRAAALVPELEKLGRKGLTTRRILLAALRMGMASLEAETDPHTWPDDDDSG